MLQFGRTFEKEKNALQELNRRLREYLSRVKQLEEENSFLIREISTIRQEETNEWETKNMAELRELRNMVNQLSFEKSKAEMEKQALLREIKMFQTLCCEESALCRDVDGELRACKTQLKQTHKTNLELEDHLHHLENECKCVEEAHRRQVAELRRQLHSRTLPLVNQKTQPASPAIRVEEVEKWALSLSDTYVDAFNMYQKRVGDMEKSLRSGEAKLEELRHEKMQYASEFQKLHSEVERQKQLQMQLEEQLVNIQESCCVELSRLTCVTLQAVVDDLEGERRSLAAAIADTLRGHQELMQVKMGLSLEVAAYRALLDREQKDGSISTGLNRRGTSRIIDIKVAPHPYTGKGTFMARKHERKEYPASRRFDGRYMEPSRRMAANSGSTQNRCSGATRIVPITVCGSHEGHPPSRMELRLLSGSPRAAMSIINGLPSQTEENVATKICDRRPVPDRLWCSAEDLGIRPDSDLKVRSDHSPSSAMNNESANLMSPSATREDTTAQDDNVGMICVKAENGERDKNTPRAEMEGNAQGFCSTQVKTQDCLAGDQFVSQISSQSQIQDNGHIEQPHAEPKQILGEGKVLDSVCMEEIIEKVMKPAGLDPKVSSSSDSKVTYLVEKSEGEDGTAKTQIILQSKVEEDVDISDESVLEELLSKGVKKVALEDIEGTPTGSMIENLLSLGLQGDETLENKSLKIEIIEEPLDEKENPVSFQPSSMFFQIEEVDNDHEITKYHDDQSDASRTPLTAKEDYRESDSVQIQESSGDLDSLVYDQDHETEYFVSTPDDDISEPDEGVFSSSIGHYSVVDDLSDERYYQEDSPVNQRFEEAEHYRASPKMTYMKSERTFSKEHFPESIIEEEVQMSPTELEPVFELLQQDSTDLKGLLQNTLGTVSRSLKEELDHFTKTDEEALDSLAVKSVEQTADNGTVTIVAELNVSQRLKDSGIMEGLGKDDTSEDKIMEALQSSSVDLQKMFSSGITASGADREDVLNFSGDQGGKAVDHSDQEGFTTKESTIKVNKTEKHIKLGPSEKLFTFQMDISNLAPASSSRNPLDPQYLNLQMESGQDDTVKEMGEGRCRVFEMKASNEKPDEGSNLDQTQKGLARCQESCSAEEVGFGHFVHSHLAEPQLRICEEKRVATVYLESHKEN
ncbi:synemin [Arapaima gigas]